MHRKRRHEACVGSSRSAGASISGNRKRQRRRKGISHDAGYEGRIRPINLRSSRRRKGCGCRFFRLYAYKACADVHQGGKHAGRPSPHRPDNEHRTLREMFRGCPEGRFRSGCRTGAQPRRRVREADEFKKPKRKRRVLKCSFFIRVLMFFAVPVLVAGCSEKERGEPRASVLLHLS